ncbi:tyrosine-protein phosphatase [Enterococcus ureasiticus]|uniref:Tyrosine-protein phosphatase n=1 Tax=Enterococcus ureasiticus TaxID=903984 RepID=A0A1E5GGW2_9ENTE|nr:CpsB/CapC family capsule biosynthesis tyrosine phosphatase [Enterococcus ureasiticus]OEG11958.1 tyrosine protein phosphatase [Enterococcus ureasiticus]
MIDLHCHILPGIDDGPKTIEESLEMAEKAVADGILRIVCTPHYSLQYPNTRMFIAPKVQQLQQELDKRKLPLTLYAGQEVRLTGELMHQIETDKIQFIDPKKRYFLLEFPKQEVPFYAVTLIEKVIKKGTIPIIVHPECNLGFIKDPNKLIPFIELGALTQVTAPSLLGLYGKQIQTTAEKMVDHGLIHMLASDAHRRQERDFYLREAYKVIERTKGIAKVQEWKTTAENVLAGQTIIMPSYRPISHKKFWLFN